MDAEVSFGRFIFSLPHRQLWHEGQPVTLKPKEVELLALLAARRPSSVSRDEIIERLWQGSGSDAALNQTVYRLRRALGKYAEGDMIRTVPEVGFHLAGGSPIDVRNDNPDYRRSGFADFQRAASLYAQRTEASTLEAIAILERVRIAEPLFVPALVLLAKSYTSAGIRLFYKPMEAYWRARSVLERLLEADPSNADGFATLSTLLLFFNASREQAREAAERALVLAPHSPVARSAAVWERLSRRDFAAAVTQADVAINARPQSSHATSLLGVALYMSEQFDEAERAFTNALALDPSHSSALFYLACTHAMTGNYLRAASELDKITGSDMFSRTVAARGYIAAKTGEMTMADRAIAMLEAMAMPSDVSVCAVHLAKNDRASAAASLARALQTREPGLFLTAIDPMYAALRSAEPCLVARVEAGRPKQCDRCGTEIAGARSSDFVRCELCWQCRHALRQRGTSHDSKATS